MSKGQFDRCYSGYYPSTSRFVGCEEILTGLQKTFSPYYWFDPECGHEENIFGEGATDEFLKHNKIPLLGKIPIEPAFASSGDTGKPLVLDSGKDYMKVIYNDLASSLVDRLAKIEKPSPKVEDIAVEITSK